MSDQPQAIEALVRGINEGNEAQTLLSVTPARPSQWRILLPAATAHADSGAEQDASQPDLHRNARLSRRMPSNIFVSYYDLPAGSLHSALRIPISRKDSAINDEIDRLRHSVTAALSEQRNVIIEHRCLHLPWAIPIDYRSMVISLRPGMQMEPRRAVQPPCQAAHMSATTMNFIRNKFRVKRGTRWIFILPITMNLPSAWSFQGMRLTASLSLTR